MAFAICLDCEFNTSMDGITDWRTKNLEDHHIVIIADGNKIEGKEATKQNERT